MELKKLYGEDRYLLIILFIIALIIRSIVFIETGDFPGDGAYRIILTINWLKDPYLITGGLWPPLYIYLTALIVKILGDPFNSIRLVSLIFGTIVIFPYYYLVKSLFNRRMAAISTLILTFLSIHIQYSTYSMSEIPFAFFLITSLYFFFRFKKGEKKMADLIVSAIFLNLASMTRYEAWLFIPLLAIFTLNMENVKKIFWNLKNKDDIKALKNDRKYFFTFLIISLIFPISWMIGSYHLYGDPLYGQSWSDNWIRTNTMLNPDSQWLNPPLYKKLTAWPGAILYILNIVSIFAGIGLLVSLLKKRNLEFLSIFLIFTIVFTYKLINVTMLLQPRHIIVPILFLIPYFTIGLDYSLDYSKFLDKNWSRIIPIIIIGIFITTSSYTAIVKNPYIVPGYVFDVSNWLKDNVGHNDTVLLDEYNWWGLHILIFSGLNTTFTEDYLKTYEFVTDQVRLVPGGGKKIDEATVINYLKNKPTYLVYFPKGKLGRILNISSELSSGCQNEIRINYSFECKYETKYYNIYQLKPINK